MHVCVSLSLSVCVHICACVCVCVATGEEIDIHYALADMTSFPNDDNDSDFQGF